MSFADGQSPRLPVIKNIPFSVQKTNQLRAIGENIHIIEALRKKLNLSFSELAHVFDITNDDLAVPYGDHYPSEISKKPVNTFQNQRVRFVLAINRESTLPAETLAKIFNIPNYYNFCVRNNCWPASRSARSTVLVQQPSAPSIEFIGNKREILPKITKIRKLFNASVEVNSEIDDGFFDTYIDAEKEYHANKRKNLARMIANIVEDERDPSELQSKCKEILSEIKGETDRHKFVIGELIKLADEAQKIVPEVPSQEKS